MIHAHGESLEVLRQSSKTQNAASPTPYVGGIFSPTALLIEVKNES